MTQPSATTNAATVPSHRSRNRASLMKWYTGTISVIGLLISIYAFLHLPGDLLGLGLFVLMAILAETTSVELFDSSHSQVSMSSVVAIASVIALGPTAGVITYLASGISTAAKTPTGNKSERTSLIVRTSFNAGMWAITALTIGYLYVFLGGVPGGELKINSILPITMIALVEYFLNVLILLGVITLQTGQSVYKIWERDFKWQSLMAIAGGLLGGGLLALGYGMFGILGFVIILLPVLSTSYAFRSYKNNMTVYVDGLETLNKDLKSTLSALEKANADLTGANQSILRLNAELFQSLAKVFDMRDPYVGGHAAQVAIYAVSIAKELGLPSERIELVRQAAYLHDIGKLAIPEAILHKPGKLTEIEYEFIKKHTDIGADLLASTEGLQHLAPFIRHHHERWDGAGYPLGLKGDEIPLEARILNVCDSVETMASDRPYHRGKSMREIIAEVERCAGTQFDPEISETFVNLALKKVGSPFVINSARSVTQQYAASLLANESLTHSMFAWVLENDAQKQIIEERQCPRP